MVLAGLMKKEFLTYANATFATHDARARPTVANVAVANRPNLKSVSNIEMMALFDIVREFMGGGGLCWSKRKQWRWYQHNRDRLLNGWR
jgi:hypothetical protein